MIRIVTHIYSNSYSMLIAIKQLIWRNEIFRVGANDRIVPLKMHHQV